MFKIHEKNDVGSENYTRNLRTELDAILKMKDEKK